MVVIGRQVLLCAPVLLQSMFPSLYTIPVVLVPWIWQCVRWWNSVAVIFASPERSPTGD